MGLAQCLARIEARDAAVRGWSCRGIVDQPNVQGRKEPFNIKAASVTLRNFNAEEVRERSVDLFDSVRFQGQFAADEVSKGPPESEGARECKRLRPQST
jgi:hypothetical protein